MNLTKQLEQIIEATQNYLNQPTEGIPEGIQSELDQVVGEIEQLLADWEPAPDSLKSEVEAMDRQFIAAGDLYLDACDDIQEALETSSQNSLELAKKTLAAAGKQLESADEQANQQFRKWADPGASDPRSFKGN
jgi:hypothetical protein